MMNQKTSPFDKQRKVSALRDSRHGCDTQTNVKKPRREVYGDVVALPNGKGKNLVGSAGSGDHSNHTPKEAESLDLVIMRSFNPPRRSKVELLSSEDSKKLLESQSKRRVTIKKKHVVVKAGRAKKASYADASRRSSQLGGDLVIQQNKVTQGRVNAAIKNHPMQAPRRVEQEPADQDHGHLVAVPEPSKGIVGSGRCEGKFNPRRESKVKVLSSEESRRLLVSQSTRRHVKKVSNKTTQQNRVQKKVNAAVQKKDATHHRDESRSNQVERVPVRQHNRVPKRTHNPAAKNQPVQAPTVHDGTRVEQEPADQDRVVSVAERNGQEGEIRNADYDPTAREKVLEVLRFFKQVFKRLQQEKEARRGGDLFQATSRIDIMTLDVIESMGKKVNVEKRLGSVPGIKVGDEFQYRTELRVVGLHSKVMFGIDYMKIGDMNFATCIVASGRYGYKNRFDAGVIIYIGEGGNVISTERRTHQKMTKGNLAMANSMREKREVRVIRGEQRNDNRGQRYVYLGLYLVDRYWAEKEDRGKIIYKFKLSRIPGQPQVASC